MSSPADYDVAVDDVEVGAADSATMAELANLFRSWPKPPELFDRYARRADDGHIDFLTARVHGQLAGYCLIEWTSAYSPFAAAGIPEICDLTVTRELRGTALDERCWTKPKPAWLAALPWSESGSAYTRTTAGLSAFTPSEDTSRTGAASA